MKTDLEAEGNLSAFNQTTICQIGNNMKTSNTIYGYMGGLGFITFIYIAFTAGVTWITVSATVTAVCIKLLVILRTIEEYDK